MKQDRRQLRSMVAVYQPSRDGEAALEIPQAASATQRSSVRLRGCWRARRPAHRSRDTDRDRQSRLRGRREASYLDQSCTDQLRGRFARYPPRAPMVTAQPCSAQTPQCAADAIGAPRSCALHVAWRAQEPEPTVCPSRKHAVGHAATRPQSVSSCVPRPRGFSLDTLRAIASTSWRSQLDSEAGCACTTG